MVTFNYTYGTMVATGGALPESVKDAGYHLQAAGGQNATRNAHVDIHCIHPIFRKPLQPKKMATVQFAGSAMYTPVPYVPQAIGVGIGRIFAMPAIVLIYLGRTCNVLVFLVVAFLTVRLLPFGTWRLVVMALLPTTLSQAALLSADATTNGLAFVTIAYLLYKRKRAISVYSLGIPNLLRLSLK